MGGILCAVGLLALVRGDAAGGDGMEARRTIRVMAPGSTCPTSALLAQSVASALREDWTVTRDAQAYAATSVTLEDNGTRFRVSVSGHEPHWFEDRKDRKRDCEERAYTAAVWIALAVNPPAGEPDAGAPDASSAVDAAYAIDMARAIDMTIALPSPVVDAGEARTPATRPITLDVEAFGGAAFSPDVTGSTTGGGGFRFALGTAYHVGFALGGSVMAPVSLALDRGRASLLRAPFDLDLRLALRRGQVEGALDLGVALSLLQLTGDGYAGNQSPAIPDFALRGALALRIWPHARFALLIGAETLWSPVRQSLLVGDTVVGHTPGLWLSAFGGVLVRIR